MRRRDYLKVTGGAIGGSVLLTGATVGYDSSIDVVSDLGVDNSGNSVVDDDLEPSLRDGTRLEFPDGRYRIDQLVLYGLDNFAMVGTGDATLVPGNVPDDDLWIGGGDVQDLTFEGFRIDNTGDVGPTVGFGTTGGLLLRDIEKVGAHASHRPAFSVSVWDSNQYALIENVRATDGDIYSDSVGATGFYTKSAGTVTFKDCELAGWGDNGLYASDATGIVAVKGGYYANNNIAQIRLSSPGSFVRGATVRVDEPRGGIPNMRGIRISEGPGMVDVVDCDISMERGQGSGGVVTAYDGGSVNVVNSRIHVGEDYTTVGSNGGITSYGILVDDPTGIDVDTEQIVRNTSITGGGNRGGAILFRRGNTTVDGCCIEQTGDGRDGVIYQTSEGGNVVEDSTIDVSGVVVDENSAGVSISGISKSGSCPVPSGVDSGSGGVSVPSAPIPPGAQDFAHPIFGTAKSNPTAIIYGDYTDPEMRSFVDDNLGRLIEDFVQTGRLNLQIRNLPATAAETFLTQVGIGVWDKEPAHFERFFEYVFDHQSSIAYSSVDDARRLLEDAGIRNYGWIPWLAADDTYLDIVDGDLDRAGKHDLADWPDFPPLLSLRGEIAAPQYAYEGGIKSWLEQRL